MLARLSFVAGNVGDDFFGNVEALDSCAPFRLHAEKEHTNFKPNIAFGVEEPSADQSVNCW